MYAKIQPKIRALLRLGEDILINLEIKKGCCNKLTNENKKKITIHNVPSIRRL
jgi:hypothetical protein